MSVRHGTLTLVPGKSTSRTGAVVVGGEALGRGAKARARAGTGAGTGANYWAPLTRKRHTLPHPAQPRHTSYWAPRTRKRHQREHRPQRPTERSDPTQHAKGRMGDCPGPRKGATTRWNVTQGVAVGEGQEQGHGQEANLGNGLKIGRQGLPCDDA